MDAELKARWLKALRSGRYKQTRGKLYDGQGYCCLGVLCKVAKLPIRSDGNGVAGYGYSGAATHSSYEPIFELIGGFQYSHPLSMRNDGGKDFHPHNFAQIADFIEANIPVSA